jgi:hypothetical protein
MLTLADLRAQRGAKDFNAITQALTKKTEYANDKDGFWTLTRDKAGNGSAVIRFLPKHQDDELPWVQMYSHGFQSDSGKWFIDNCASTIGGDCPLCQENRHAYTKGNDADKEVAKKRKRKLAYFANILVVKDPANPDNEGKVMQFSFGKKIFEMIADKTSPTFEDETPVNVFDLWEGADFKIRMHQADGWPSYAKSSWSDVKPVAEDDEAILAIVNQQKPLAPFVDPKKFKSYEDIKKRLDSVLNGAPASTAKAEDMVKQMQKELSESKPKAEKSVGKAKSEPQPWEDDDAKAEPEKSGEEDELENYFKSIAS